MVAVEHVRVVLVGTQESGNLGMVARAMKNFGLRRLVLVSPEARVNDEALKFAVGARDVLEGATVVDDLSQALAGVELCAGATARAREVYPGTLMTPRQAAPILRGAAEEGLEVALVFGRERSGLTNDELARCHHVLRIPTAPDFKSLNLAQAVLVVAYELFSARSEPFTAPRPAPVEGLEAFFSDFETMLLEIGYADEKRMPHVMRTFRRIFHKALLTPNELAMLRGLVRQTRWAAGRGGG